MLMSVLRILVNNLVKKSFYEKNNNNNILTVFFFGIITHNPLVVRAKITLSTRGLKSVI